MRQAGQAALARRAGPRTRLRWILAGVAAVAAFFAIAESLARVVSRADPGKAGAIWSLNGRIQAKASERMFANQLDAGARERALDLARAALRLDATAVEAVSVLALQAQLSGQSDRAQRLFTYAQTLSRRELGVQIVGIELEVARGQIAKALLHYDIALRTSRRAPDLLFPVLARSVAEPRVRVALLQMLAAKPVWTRGFINHLAVNVAEPRATVQFFREATRIGLPVLDVERVAVVDALVNRGLYADAWSYYASFRGNPDRRRSRDPNFMAAPTNPATFDWSPSNESGLIASIQPGRGGGVVDFSAPSGVGGAVLRQTQLLPAGEYRLEGRSAAIDLPASSSPYWTLTCPDGRELGRVTVPNSAEANGSFGGVFRVPSECPLQTLSLVARAVDGMSGLSGQIERVSLHPA